MSITENIEADVRYLKEIVSRLLRVGVVSTVNPDNATVRVKIGDQSDLVTYECPVVFAKTHNDKAYWMPDPGDHVLVLSLPYGVSQGFVLGAVYSRTDTVPVSSRDKWRYEFKDGSVFEYDRNKNHLDINVKGTVALHADGAVTIDSGKSVAVTAPRIDLN